MDDAFVKDYERLVSSIAYKYAHLGLPVEDLIQEGMIGLLEANRHYREDKGASFATYSTFWIKKKILRYIDKELKEKQNISFDQPIETSLALSTSTHSLGGGGGGVSQSPVETRLALSLPDDMPPSEKAILTLYFVDKKSLVEIAQILDISREKARQLKNKALRRYKAYLKPSKNTV